MEGLPPMMSPPKAGTSASLGGAALSVEKFIESIDARKAVVGIVGLGYVGLPLSRTFCAAGFQVLGLDVDSKKVDQLNKGKSYIKHISSASVKEMVDAKMLRATANPKDLRRCAAILICVPTPLTKTRDPDMSYVVGTAEMIAKHLQPGQLVTLESTTYPGTTRDLIQPILEQSGLKADKDFFLAYSPEREDPGREDFTTETIPKGVGGIVPKSSKVAVALYDAAISKAIGVSSCEVAECSKILENVYRCVNIALINELKMLHDRKDIDVWEVIKAASTKPFGFQAFYPGPGLGGHCIPIDPFYLTWRARQFDMSTRFIELSGEINNQMPDYVIARLMDALNDVEKSLKGAKILVLGLAYKKNIEDIRESPSIELIERLKGKGAKVDYNDPYVPATHKQREHNLGMKSKALSEKMLASYDCVLIATDHSDYDYPWIVKHAKLVVDTRNATAACRSHRKKIVKA